MDIQIKYFDKEIDKIAKIEKVHGDRIGQLADLMEAGKNGKLTEAFG